MTSQTANCNSSSDDSAVGSVAWTNVANAQGASFADFATASMPASGATTHYMVQGFEFSGGSAIPTGATIVGISLALYYGGDSSQIKWNSIKLRKAGTAVGNDNSNSAALPLNTPSTPVTFGSSSDLWGTTWADTDFGTGAGFAVQVQLIHTGLDPTKDAKAFGASATVTYTTTQDFTRSLTVQTTVLTTVVDVRGVSSAVTAQVVSLVTAAATAARPVALTVQTIVVTTVGRLLDLARALSLDTAAEALAVRLGDNRAALASAVVATTRLSRLGRLARTLVSAVTPTARGGSASTSARAQIVGRLLTAGGVPCARVPVTVSLAVSPTTLVATIGGGVVARGAATATTTDGSFALTLFAAQALLPTGLAVFVRVGEWTRRVLLPVGDGATADLDGTVRAPPAWTAPPTCTVYGTLRGVSGVPRVGVPLTFTLPPDVLLADGSLVVAPVTIITGADGVFATPLLTAAAFATPGVRATVRVGTAPPRAFTVPSAPTLDLGTVI